MEARVHEIAPDVFRLNVAPPDAPINFGCFLIRDDQPAMVEVTVDIGGGREIVAAITRESIERLGLSEGVAVVALIKATEVMLARD